MVLSADARRKAAGEDQSSAQIGPQTAGAGRDPLAGPETAPTGEAFAQTLFEFDPSSGRLHWSDPDAAERLFGHPPSGARAELDRLIEGGEPDVRRACFAGETTSYSCEFRLDAAAGPVWVEERGGWLATPNGRRLISVLRSIEDDRRRQARLHWLAANDELTGLLNRAHLRLKIDEFLAAAEGRRAVYVLAGIDDLGAINADFGFEAADEVIVEIARRLNSVIGPDDAIGRVAGTKFGILIVNADAETMRETSIKLLNVVREKVVASRRGAIATSISIGAVRLPEDAQNSQGAMARAEAALDQAKRIGRSSWSSFSEKTDVVSMRRRNSHMSDVILTALNERRVRLAFQPIVADLGESPLKFECLIRMRAPDGREVPAPDFIPVAERLGLVHLLDRRVLELALNTLATCPHIHLNVNISMETVKDPVWAEGYLAHLRANSGLAKRVQVELTETQVIDAIDSSIEFVTEVKALGASFAIDDFGAGYTSFRNLKALDIDTLKIDGSFVTGVSQSRENQLFVRTLLDLARNFSMKTVAEWVDNEADAMLLKGLGVDYLQGYLIGKPETNPAWLPSGAPNEAPSLSLRA
jgi:diguanylate cyclase (GGDEF)-like protein